MRGLHTSLKWVLSVLLAVVLIGAGASSFVLADSFSPDRVAESVAYARYDTLNFIFAIDTSASMDTRLDSGNWNNADSGVRMLANQTGASGFAPTDPTNSRFETVEFMLRFLADFSQTQRARDLSIWARVITFDSAVRTEVPGWPDWQGVSNPDDIELPPPSRTSDNRHSDFGALFSAVPTIQAQAPVSDSEGGGTKTILLVITDSTPCKDPPQTNYCAGIQEANLQLNSINVSPDLEVHLLSIVDEYQEVFQALDWEHLTSPERIRYLESVEELPNVLIDILAMALSEALGPALPTGENTPVLTPRRAFENIGVIEITGGQFEIPPYVSDMLLIAYNQEHKSPDIEVLASPAGVIDPDDFQAGYATSNSALTSYMLAHPTPGIWTVNQFLNNNKVRAWVMFYPPSRAEIVVKPADSDDNTLQYETIEVEYRLYDQANQVILPHDGYTPNFVISVSNSNLEKSFTFQEMLRSAEGFTGEFLALKAGQYLVDAQVTAPDAWQAGVGGFDFSYLNPVATDAIVVAPVVWQAEFMNGSDRYAPGATVADFPRGRSAKIEVFASANGERIDFPPEADIHLSFATPQTGYEGVNACPEQDTVQPASWLNTDNRSKSYAVPLTQPGQCDLLLYVSYIDKDLPPFRPPAEYLEPAVEYDMISTPWHLLVDRTTLVEVLLVAADGQKVEPYNLDLNVETPRPVYRMQNRIGPPIWFENGNILTWEADEVTIEVVFQDYEIKEGYHPTPNSPIPLRYKLERNNQDYTAPDVKFERSAKDGYYTLTLTGLAVGTYNLTVELLPDQPVLDDEINSYYPELQHVIANGTIPQFRAVVKVEVNSYADRLEWGLMGSTGLVVLLILIIIVRFLLNWYAPLSGRLYIYARTSSEVASQQIIWEKPLRRRNVHDFHPKDLPMARPGVTTLIATTERKMSISRAREALITLEVNNLIVIDTLKPGQLPSAPFYTDVEGTQFFIAKDIDKKMIQNGD